MVDLNFAQAMKGLRYGVSKTGFISQALKGYTGHRAITSELLQNADDAEATSVSFHVRTDMLVVRNNSTFSPQDFRNISEIAAGGKRQEASKIGTFGTGFISVYHITDHPEVLSSGYRLVFDPLSDTFDPQPCDVVDVTEFRLPWRFEESELSRLIESAVWTDESIGALADELTKAIYPLSLFLRHVMQIQVFFQVNGEDRLYASIERKRVDTFTEPEFRQDTWIISSKQGTRAYEDYWLYYSSQVPATGETKGLTVKDYDVSIAFPVRNSDRLKGQIPGKLYNFLPTEIETGFGFQINGAFYPDNNRKGILDDLSTQAVKTQWNHQVLNTAGSLFVNAMIDIRDRLEEADEKPYRLYELLPTTPVRRSYLEAIRRQFLKAAVDTPIVFSSLQTWQLPRDVRAVRPGSKLAKLVAEYIPLLPEGMTQEFRDVLVNELQVGYVSWVDALEFLLPHLIDGQPLEQSQAMIDSREKLQLLYDELLAAGNDPRIASAAIFLSDLGRLNTAVRLWRANSDFRILLPAGNPLFVDAQFELMPSTFRFFETHLQEFRGRDLADWLWENKEQQARLENDLFLRRTLDLFHSDLENIDPNKLAALPLVRSEPADGDGPIFFPANPNEPEQLAQFGLRFVHSSWEKDAKVRTVYKRIGIRELHPTNVIDAFKRRPVDDLEALFILYRYFMQQHTLSDADREAIRHLPLVKTQRGKFIAPAREIVFLAASVESAYLNALGKLELDNLVDSSLESHQAFLRILGIKPLTPEHLIQQVIAKNYGDDRLTDDDRKDLLRYIRQVLDGLPQAERSAIEQTLGETAVIQVRDGGYSEPRAVYFASPTLDEIFDKRYLSTHASYQIGVAEAGDSEEAPFRLSEWYLFFRRLGVNEDVRPEDIVDAVRRITLSGPPNPERIQSIQRIYRLLDALPLDDPEVGPVLKPLSELAWLPAQQPEFGGWYAPTAIFRAAHLSLVSSVAPCLPYSDALATIKIREFLGMTQPPGRLIADHLLNMARQKQPISEAHLYAQLGPLWDNTTIQQRSALYTEPVIWDPTEKHYWTRDQVFLDVQMQDSFGHRRGYVQTTRETAGFYEKMAVKAQATPEDRVALLQEIEKSYPTGQVVREDDKHLLLTNFDYLGQENKLAGEIKRRLTLMRIVPDPKGLLRRGPEMVMVDKPALLEHFPPDTVPRVPDEFLNGNIRQFLKNIGVEYLSKVIQLRPVETVGPRPSLLFTGRVLERSEAFHRIAFNSESKLPLPPEGLEIYTATVIRILHEIPKLRIQGKSHNVDSLFDPVNKRLYVLERDTGWQLLLAKGLKELLFPEADLALTVILEGILGQKPLEVSAYLDARDYKPLPIDAYKPLVLPRRQAVVEEAVEPAPELTADAGLSHDSASLDATILPPQPSEPMQADKWPQTNEPKAPSTQTQEVKQSVVDLKHGEAPTLPPQTTNAQQKGSGPEPAETALPPKQMQMPEPRPARDDVSPPPQSNDAMRDEHKADIRAVPENLPPTVKPLPLASPPLPKNNHDLSADNEPTRAPKDQPEPPPFTGQRVPAVPVRPNNYGALKQKYGMSPKGTLPDIDDDEEPESAQAGEAKRATHVSTVRIVLSFIQREQGFLPLGTNARTMLKAGYTELRCQTDDPEWEFPLYVDYEEGILYNQERLPAFFDAFNIPAGGVVYLELVHEKTVRLYWKPASAKAEEVLILELQADGKVNEIYIDAVEFPCEIDEFVMRAEKRLEDPAALFMQALDQSGVFEEICKVFDPPERVMTFAEIFRALGRQVAKSSIHYQLSQRRCFIKVGNDSWRFDPRRGWDFKGDNRRQEMTKQVDGRHQGAMEGVGRSDRGQPHSTDRARPSIEGPYASLYQSAIREFSEWSNSAGKLSDSRATVYELVTLLKRLASQLETKFQNLENQSDDSVLRQYWKGVEQNPAVLSRQAKLVEFLEQNLAYDNWTQLIAAISQLLDETAPEARSVFHVQLDKLARDSKRRAPVAAALYRLLQQQGAGDFEKKIQALEEKGTLHEEIEQITHLPIKERLNLWADLLQRYPDRTLLNDAIIKDVQMLAAETQKAVNAAISDRKVLEAFDLYRGWLREVIPLSACWEPHAVRETVWADLPLVFEWLVKQGEFQKALEILAFYPARSPLPISIHEFIGAAENAAAELSSPFAAGVLLDYAIFSSSVDNLKAHRDISISVHKGAANYYENDIPEMARYHLEQAKRLEVQWPLAGSVKSRPQVPGWLENSARLLLDEAFAPIVNHLAFEGMRQS